ncbi:hypothetical protein LCGC14_0743240 [marine sediment metagenome]|uniref:Uncharacterized protein n=1 Tax=marine sediment metagenome TaxID=412755 RepID=A0A0F9QAA7_9ZZZZ
MKDWQVVVLCFVFGLIGIAFMMNYAHTCKVMPVADRQRVFYKLGYLDYDDIDGVCGPKTHFAQRLYEHDWEAVKRWKAEQE